MAPNFISGNYRDPIFTRVLFLNMETLAKHRGRIRTHPIGTGIFFLTLWVID